MRRFRTRYPRTPRIKGKEKAPPIDVIQIDSDSESSTPGSKNPLVGSSTSQPVEFILHRLPSNTRNELNNYRSKVDHSFLCFPGKSHWDPSVRVVPLSREEESKLFNFISSYPKGDLRLSTVLYEKYHLQAPEFSADEYRTYYLAHQWKLHALEVTPDLVATSSSDELKLEDILTCPNRSKVAASLGISPDLLDRFVKLQDDVFPSMSFDH